MGPSRVPLSPWRAEHLKFVDVWMCMGVHVGGCAEVQHYKQQYIACQVKNNYDIYSSQHYIASSDVVSYTVKAEC